MATTRNPLSGPTKKSALWVAAQAVALLGTSLFIGCHPNSSAQTEQATADIIRIGFVTDLSGPYEAVDGKAGAEAIRWAIADAGGLVNGRKVELLTADHHNNIDSAAAQARRLFEAGADVLLSGVNSETSLAMSAVATKFQKPFIVIGAGTTAQTNAQCSPYAVQYAYNTAALAKVAGLGVTKAGGKSWYLLTADYEFGHQLQAGTEAAVKAAGGQVRGAVRHAHEARDFTPYLEKAQASQAQVLGLASGHTTLLNAVKQADSLRLNQRMKLVGLLMFVDDIHALGLPQAQGIYLADSWYWTRDAETRAWAKRFFQRFQRMPSSLQVADYSAASQYLKAVGAARSQAADKVLAQLHKATINDVFMKNGHLRPDGVLTHDMYLLQVKQPSQSTEPWDYYNLVETLVGEAGWPTKAESQCPLWK